MLWAYSQHFCPSCDSSQTGFNRWGVLPTVPWTQAHFFSSSDNSTGRCLRMDAWNKTFSILPLAVATFSGTGRREIFLFFSEEQTALFYSFPSGGSCISEIGGREASCPTPRGDSSCFTWERSPGRLQVSSSSSTAADYQALITTEGFRRYIFASTFLQKPGDGFWETSGRDLGCLLFLGLSGIWICHTSSDAAFRCSLTFQLFFFLSTFMGAISLSCTLRMQNSFYVLSFVGGLCHPLKFNSPHCLETSPHWGTQKPKKQKTLLECISFAFLVGGEAMFSCGFSKF